jgi:hypothetical protein
MLSLLEFSCAEIEVAGQLSHHLQAPSCTPRGALSITTSYCSFQSHINHDLLPLPWSQSHLPHHTLRSPRMRLNIMSTTDLGKALNQETTTLRILTRAVQLPVSSPSPVTWQTAFWTLIPLAINVMAQPSGRVCGAPSRYRTYLRSSPFFFALRIRYRFSSGWPFTCRTDFSGVML